MLTWLKDLSRVGDLVHAMECIGTQEELDLFKKACKKQRILLADVGYYTGHISHGQRAYLFHVWPELSHPVFGRRVDITPEEAFAAGIKAAAELADKPKKPKVVITRKPGVDWA